MIIAQLIVNSLIIGSIYGLVACGFSLIYSTNRFIHFAHGVSIVIAGYMLLLFHSTLGLPFILSCILSIIITSLIGWGMYNFIFASLQKRNASNVILLIASIGILIFFQNLIQIIFGAGIKSMNLFQAKSIEIFGAIITPLQVVIILVSICLFFALYLFTSHTKIGRDMRAVADDRQLASIMGINTKKIANYSFIIGSALAGIAGILITLEQNLSPFMGTNLMIKGFTGAVIGSISFVPGAILGSFLLGFFENFGIWFLPSVYRDAIAFFLLFLFLLLKPKGIFNWNKGVKK
ncbi:branched-chain amino acid ABC transporter permease [Candidatus Woesearchaeota archaeon]|nr:branched-chain amino acid ABC transporter permease [Candidatus Woesearchaeota archaeon]